MVTLARSGLSGTGQPLVTPADVEAALGGLAPIDSSGRALSTTAGADCAIFVGGVDGATALASTAGSSGGRLTGRMGLYMHANSMAVIQSAGLLPQLASIWTLTGPGMAELGVFPTSWFAPGGTFDTLYAGFAPTSANVNVTGGGFDPMPSASDLTAFEVSVTAMRTRGIVNVAPVVTPNAGTEPISSTFGADSAWAVPRQMALYGGGLAIDAPPAYFFARSAAYRAFVISEIVWALANNLRTTVLLSPYGDATEFEADCYAMHDALSAAGAVPTSYVVLNYDVASTNSDGSATPSGTDLVGAEGTAGSILDAAMHVARRLPTGDLPASLTGLHALAASAIAPPRLRGRSGNLRPLLADIDGAGSIARQDASAVSITGGTAVLGSVTIGGGTAGFSLLAAGAANIGVLTAPPGLPVYVVAGLGALVQPGPVIAYASNGRKPGEVAGSGTGVLVVRDPNGQWISAYSGQVVTA